MARASPRLWGCGFRKSGYDPTSAYFCADIIWGYDSDMNGAFDAKETAAVLENAFGNLRKYFIFTFIRQGRVPRRQPGDAEHGIMGIRGLCVDVAPVSRGALFPVPLSP